MSNRLPPHLQAYLTELRATRGVLARLFPQGSNRPHPLADLQYLHQTCEADSIEANLLEQWIEATENNDAETLDYLRTLEARVRGAIDLYEGYRNRGMAVLQSVEFHIEEILVRAYWPDREKEAYIEGLRAEARRLSGDS